MLPIEPIIADRKDPSTLNDSWNVQQHNTTEIEAYNGAIGEGDVEATIRDIRSTLQRTKTLLGNSDAIRTLDDRDQSSSPVWIPRYDFFLRHLVIMHKIFKICLFAHSNFCGGTVLASVMP